MQADWTGIARVSASEDRETQSSTLTSTQQRDTMLFSYLYLILAQGEVTAMKNLMNQPEHYVDETLKGIYSAHPTRYCATGENLRALIRAGTGGAPRVAVVTGGGSGHLPVFLGYVGEGLLAGCAVGNVFASPPASTIETVARAVHCEQGVLFVYGNYQGDVMNFEMAEEMAESSDIKVESVVINDDVAVEDSTYTAGRRGVGGTVLVEKLCGAAAERGASLQKVTDLCKRCNDDVRSMGMALTSCTVPAAGEPTFDLGEDEMEIGIGIHGEPGRKRMEIEPADKVVERLMEPILEDLPFKEGDDVLLFMNSMGGTPLLELYLAYRKAADIAEQHGLRVVRNLVGPYITSLEMAGISITMMRMNDKRVELWDAPVHTPGLRWGM